MLHLFQKEPKDKPDPTDDIIVIKKTEPNTCGGTDAIIDRRFPRTILSDEPIFFSVTSALPSAISDSGEDRLGYLSAFAAPAGEGCFLFLSTGERFAQRDEKTNTWALVKKDLFPELAALIREADFAANNGFHSTTHGLPENFGGSISIHYASGEKISISDNQSPVCSAEIGRKIVALFTETMKGEKIPLPAPEDLQAIRFCEERNNDGFCRAALTLREDGTAVNERTQKFSDTQIYESRKEVDAGTVAELKKVIADCALFAWGLLPQSAFAFGHDKTLTFVMKNGKEITVPNHQTVPEQLKNGFFQIELEMAHH